MVAVGKPDLTIRSLNASALPPSMLRVRVARLAPIRIADASRSNQAGEALGAGNMLCYKAYIWTPEHAEVDLLFF